MALVLAAAAASLFFSEPQPLNMPRAEAYLVTRGARSYLEDRYGVLDLWTSQAVLGRWEDEGGRVFMLSSLEAVPPVFHDMSKTRVDYAADRRTMEKGDLSTLGLAVSHLSPCEMPDEPEEMRRYVHGIEKAFYYHGTNTSAIVCAFLPRESKSWYLATWELAAEDDFGYCLREFEDDFLEKWGELSRECLPTERDRAKRKGESGRRKGATRPSARG